MFRLRKQPAPITDLPLTLETAGSLRRTFPADQIGQLRRMLTDLAVDQRLPARIGFTSALRGEGVSYLTLAAALTLTHDTGKRVCVVELNWLAPGMLANLNPAPPPASRQSRRATPPATPPLPILPGVAETLQGQASLEETLLSTNHPGLALIPAGTATIAQRPLLARSAELRALIDQIATQFDHVFLDLPAVLATSDTLALATLAQTCALVVRQGVTQITEVQRALSDLAHMPLLGVILNQARLATPSWIQRLIPQE